jgi:hypothetical protein
VNLTAEKTYFLAIIYLLVALKLISIVLEKIVVRLLLINLIPYDFLIPYNFSHDYFLIRSINHRLNPQKIKPNLSIHQK